jgi:hypothetical protein
VITPDVDVAAVTDGGLVTGVLMVLLLLLLVLPPPTNTTTTSYNDVTTTHCQLCCPCMYQHKHYNNLSTTELGSLVIFVTVGYWYLPFTYLHPCLATTLGSG